MAQRIHEKAEIPPLGPRCWVRLRRAGCAASAGVTGPSPGGRVLAGPLGGGGLGGPRVGPALSPLPIASPSTGASSVWATSSGGAAPGLWLVPWASTASVTRPCLSFPDVSREEPGGHLLQGIRRVGAPAGAVGHSCPLLQGTPGPWDGRAAPGSTGGAGSSWVRAGLLGHHFGADTRWRVYRCAALGPEALQASAGLVSLPMMLPMVPDT